MESSKHPEPQAVEREIIVDNYKYRVKSVFIGHTKLEDALTKIVMKRLENSKPHATAS